MVAPNLGGLPSPVVQRIGELLDPHQLLLVIPANRYLRFELDLHLYRKKIIIKSAAQAQLFANSLLRTSYGNLSLRRRCVKDLTVAVSAVQEWLRLDSPAWGINEWAAEVDRAHAAWPILLPLMGSFVNLERLTIETPARDVSRLDLYLEQAITDGHHKTGIRWWLSPNMNGAALSTLKALTLHLDGLYEDRPRSEWHLTPFITLFQLPALEELEIGNAVIANEIDHVDWITLLQGTTKLKSLTLINCSLFDVGFISILSLPSGLETLYIDHDWDHDNIDHDTETADFILHAIRPHSHSLRVLDCKFTRADDDRGVLPVRPEAELHSLSGFYRLEILALRSGSSLVSSVLHSQGAPPNLETLYLYRPNRHYLPRDGYRPRVAPILGSIYAVPHPNDIGAYLSSLRRLIVVGEYGEGPEIDDGWQWWKCGWTHQRRMNTESWGQQLAAIDVALEIHGVVREKDSKWRLYNDDTPSPFKLYEHGGTDSRTARWRDRRYWRELRANENYLKAREIPWEHAHTTYDDDGDIGHDYSGSDGSDSSDDGDTRPDEDSGDERSGYAADDEASKDSGLVVPSDSTRHNLVTDRDSESETEVPTGEDVLDPPTDTASTGRAGRESSGDGGASRDEEDSAVSKSKQSVTGSDDSRNTTSDSHHSSSGSRTTSRKRKRIPTGDSATDSDESSSGDRSDTHIHKRIRRDTSGSDGDGKEVVEAQGVKRKRTEDGDDLAIPSEDSSHEAASGRGSSSKSSKIEHSSKRRKTEGGENGKTLGRGKGRPSGPRPSTITTTGNATNGQVTDAEISQIQDEIQQWFEEGMLDVIWGEQRTVTVTLSHGDQIYQDTHRRLLTDVIAQVPGQVRRLLSTRSHPHSTDDHLRTLANALKERLQKTRARILRRLRQELPGEPV